MADLPLVLRSAFADIASSPTTGSGVIVSDRDGLGLATVVARKARAAALAERIRDRFGIDLPIGPHRAVVRDIAFAGTGPAAWLATREQGGNAFAASLRETIGDLASVTDQSDGYAVLRLGGPRLRETLAKIVSIDLHPRVFKPGDVALTAAAHIGATLWRLADGADGAPVFEIAVFRSLAGSFWSVLSASGAEFGVTVER